ncbi:MAG: DUF4293 domain-containing protein [Bacteroidia bacterium]
MIQRVQSLFLAAIVVLSALLMFLPFQEIISGDKHYLLYLMPGCLKEIVRPFIYLPVIVNIVVALLSLACIFMYKNRQLQMRLCQVILALSAVMISALLAFRYVSFETGTYTVNHLPASVVPVLNVVFAFLARRSIKKDEELVRSADRIR